MLWGFKLVLAPSLAICEKLSDSSMPSDSNLYYALFSVQPFVASSKEDVVVAT